MRAASALGAGAFGQALGPCRPSGLIPKPRWCAFPVGAPWECEGPALLPAGCAAEGATLGGGRWGALGHGLGPLPASPGEAFLAAGASTSRADLGPEWGGTGDQPLPFSAVSYPHHRLWGAMVNPTGKPRGSPCFWNAVWAHLSLALCHTSLGDEDSLHCTD